MPANTGYNPQDISEINRAIDALSQAIDLLEEGEAKAQLMESITNIMEVTANLEAREISPEDEMLAASEEGAGLDLGEAQPFQPEKATMKRQSQLGVVTE